MTQYIPQTPTRTSQEAEIAPVIAAYWERADFPFELVPKLARLNLGGATLAGNGCPGQSILAAVRAGCLLPPPVWHCEARCVNAGIALTPSTGRYRCLQ